MNSSRAIAAHASDALRICRGLPRRIPGDVERLSTGQRIEILRRWRIHRGGEGEAFTGLKPAGRTDPGIAAADEALVSGKGNELGRRLAAEADEAIRQRYAQALERRKQAGASVEAGREYVEAYVDYIRFVESIHRLVSEGASRKHHE